MFAPRKRSRRSRISIAPAPTSITAFVGAFAAGPEAQAVYVSSVAELEATFGSDPGDAHDAVVQFFANGGTDAWVVRGGADDLAALDGVDVINLLTLPGMCNAPSAPALAAGTAYCAARRAFFIADPPAGLASADDALAWIADPAVAAERSDLCAVYFPELVLASGGTAAPSGTLAGIYASCTAPWQAAGSGAALNGVAGLTVTISDDDSALLAAAGINGISTLSSIAVALTMSSDPESKYVSVRRLALFIETSVDRGLAWVTFEPNNADLWQAVTAEVSEFMLSLFEQGAFAGAKPDDAFYVQCQGDTENNLVNVVIGFAPLVAAEFVILEIRKLVSQSSQ